MLSHRSLFRVVAGIAMFVVMVPAAVSCTDGPPDTPGRGAGVDSQVEQRVDDSDNVPPGTLLSSSPFPTVDVRVNRAGATATRIAYRSTSGVDGAATTVTGTAFVPKAPAPAGGWPVVAYAHPGLGLAQDCAPSLYPNLLGSGAQIESLLTKGYLVVMTDYQGLGRDGPHPYLEPLTLAHNVIDSVRAVRELTPAASTRWAAFGGAEGGQAAWAAAELAPTYGAGLDMVAAVSIAPAVNLAALPQVAFERRLEGEQIPLMQYVANAALQARPDMRRSDVLRGYANFNNEVLIRCSGGNLVARNQLFAESTPEDVAPVDQATADKVSEFLRSRSVPTTFAPAPVPIMVLVGFVDRTIWLEWIAEAARIGCERGEQIVWTLRPAEGHNNLNVRQTLTWLADRFNGVPIADSCVGIP